MRDGPWSPAPGHKGAPLPRQVGVGFKSNHFSAILNAPGPVAWLEIHAENFMVEGGPRLAQLRALGERFPISIHGVGLSIGGDKPLDTDHMGRLKRLVDRVGPAAVSEHLAWSGHDCFLNDLLPLPYTRQTLDRVVSHIDTLQAVLGRRVLLENPSSYLQFEESTMTEAEFMRSVARSTGCGLLLDISNVHVSAVNLSMSASAYLDAYPLDLVEEIHLGGFEDDGESARATRANDGEGKGEINPKDMAPRLLIDTHSRPVDSDVWGLYRRVLAQTGPVATLIEWDNDVPAWPVLRAEAEMAEGILKTAPARSLTDALPMTPLPTGD